MLLTISRLIYGDLRILPARFYDSFLKYVLAKVQMKSISIAAKRRILPVHHLACKFMNKQIVVMTLSPFTVADGQIVRFCSLVCFYSIAGIVVPLYQFPTIANGRMLHV